jgi:hypothetical protein
MNKHYVFDLRQGDIITFTYTNYKGETSVRTAKFVSISYGSTEYHPEPQFLIAGYDLDKKGLRGYAVKDMSNLVAGQGVLN